MNLAFCWSAAVRNFPRASHFSCPLLGGNSTLHHSPCFTITCSRLAHVTLVFFQRSLGHVLGTSQNAPLTHTNSQTYPGSTQSFLLAWTQQHIWWFEPWNRNTRVYNFKMEHLCLLKAAHTHPSPTPADPVPEFQNKLPHLFLFRSTGAFVYDLLVISCVSSCVFVTERVGGNLPNSKQERSNQ